MGAIREGALWRMVIDGATGEPDMMMIDIQY